MKKIDFHLLFYKPETTRIALLLAFVLLMWISTPHTAMAAPAAQGNGGDLIDKLGALAKTFVMFIIGLSGLLLAIAVALGGFNAQYASLMGVPYAQATAGMKVATAIMLFALTAGSMYIANLVIDTVAGLVNTGGSIHVIR